MSEDKKLSPAVERAEGESSGVDVGELLSNAKSDLKSQIAGGLGFAESSFNALKTKSVALLPDRDSFHHTVGERMHIPFIEEWLAARHKQIWETSEYLNNRYKFSSSLARSHQMQYVATWGLGLGALFGVMASRLIPGGGFRAFRKTLFWSGLGAYSHSEIIQYKWKQPAPPKPAPKK